MNYTPTTWKTGDKISSAGLNHIEQGIAALYSGGILLVKNNGGVLDKTAAEIWGAMQTGLVLVDSGDGVSNLTIDLISSASHESSYTFTTTPSDVTYTAASDNDYPQAGKN